jgi:hypothetical protein
MKFKFSYSTIINFTAVMLLGLCCLADDNSTGKVKETPYKIAKNSSVTLRALSPQAEEATIPAGKPFTIDLLMAVKGNKTLSGASFGVQIYSPDNSIVNIDHRDTGAEYTFKSIVFSGEWSKAFNAISSINMKKHYGFDGSLPDSIYFIFAGFEGVPPNGEEKTYIKFNLAVDKFVKGSKGTLCVDSVGTGITNDFDWLFPREFEVTFGGPYCWKIEK